MFAVYDGHGGDECCNFLKDGFHSHVLESFDRKNISGSIKESCISLDQKFADKVMNEMTGDTSGSCALSLILLGKKIFLNFWIFFFEIFKIFFELNKK